MTGANTYTGLTTVGGGTLQLGDGTTDPSLLTSGVSDNSVLLYDVHTGQTANYTISGSGTLTKTGTGTLTLAGANTYTGNTLISQGTLQLGNNLALQNSVLDTTGTGALTCSAGVNMPTFGGLTGANNMTLPSNVGGSHPQSGLRRQRNLRRCSWRRDGHGSHQGRSWRSDADRRQITYTGQTTVSGGTLQLGDGATDPRCRPAASATTLRCSTTCTPARRPITRSAAAALTKTRQRHADPCCRRHLHGQYANQPRHAPNGQ